MKLGTGDEHLKLYVMCPNLNVQTPKVKGLQVTKWRNTNELCNNSVNIGLWIHNW